jgi:hypothetical protein
LWYTRVTQALTLLEHLIKNGTERVVENARDHMFKLRSLTNFSYHDGSQDKGAGGKEMRDDRACYSLEESDVDERM